MELSPGQLLVVALQLGLLVGGLIAAFRLFGRRDQRTDFFRKADLPLWRVSGGEATLLVVLIFMLGSVGQGIAMRITAAPGLPAGDVTGLQVITHGFGFHGFGLLAWVLFSFLRRRMHADYGGEVPAQPPAPRLSSPKLLRASLLTLLMALPVLSAVALLWRLAGLPDAPQDLIPIFKGVESPLIIAGMMVVACVVAPVNEELLFRGALFRSLRQRFGRSPALLVSGAAFGALHGNLAGFLPLTLLGVILALAYEKTGDIRVPILAHALFNLNTIVVLLSDIPTT